METVKELTWIGSTSFAAKEGRGDHPGCVCMKFWSVWSYNRYFRKNSKLLVVEEVFLPVLFGLLTTVVVMVTNQLSPEEMEDMNEVSREIEFAMAAKRKKKAEDREKAAEEANAKANENQRLAAVGAKYEARVKQMRAMDPTTEDRKELESLLNKGDPEILYTTKMEAFKTGYVQAMQYVRDLRTGEAK